MNILKKHKNTFLLNLPLLLLGFITISLRLINIGYSDFQGDEIKALFLPESGQSIADFLLTQRKGPIQFLVTFLLKFITTDYSSELIMRLPFAIAGILSVYFFYKLLVLEFDKKVAFYASFFLATNGFFVAFSRLVQYQSFVIFFMIASLYSFSKSSKDSNWRIKGIYIGFIFWALSILSHYDGIFIFPYVAYLLIRWMKNQVFDFTAIRAFFAFLGNRVNKKKSVLSGFSSVKHLLISLTIFIVLIAIFYVPFIFNIDDATKSYWQGRLEGTGGKISSSKYLFSVYQPIYVVHIYTILVVFGLIQFVKRFIGFEMLLSIVKSRFKTLGSFILLAFSDNFHKVIAVNLWFIIPFIFMEILVNIPGTHIYTYLVPMFIYLAFGIIFIEQISALILRHVSVIVTYVGITFVFLFIFLQSYSVFVDHAQEYPWTSEKFFIWTFPEPSPIFHLSMFGFPYYRHWEEIGDFIVNKDPVLPCPINREIEECPFKLAKIRYYSTNERSSISRYHIPFNKDTDNAGYYVYIRNPQSFTNQIIQDKAEYWTQNYEPALLLENCPEDVSTGNFTDLLGLHDGSCNSDSVPVAEVYYMMSGELDAVQKIGF